MVSLEAESGRESIGEEGVGDGDWARVEDVGE